MPIQHLEGWDDGLARTKWVLTQTDWRTSIRAGRNGNCISIGDTTGMATRTLATATDTVVIGAAFNVLTTISTWGPPIAVGQIQLLGDTGQVHLGLFLNGSPNTDEVSVRLNGTTIASATAASVLGSALTFNNWYYVEFRAVIHDTAGSFTVRINGREVLTRTSVDTRNGGADALIRSVRLQGHGNFDDRYLHSFDDMYIANDQTFRGDCVVETIYPNANGALSQFVGSDGNSTDNFALVNEATPSATNYVESATVGAIDTYAMANPTKSGPILAVAPTVWAVATNSSAPRTIAAIVRSGTTNVRAGSATLGGNYSTVGTALENDPATGAAWTRAAVDAVEIGQEVTG